jgi:phosphatidylinositol alpha-1,6-mannosyltransferase
VSQNRDQREERQQAQQIEVVHLQTWWSLHAQGGAWFGKLRVQIRLALHGRAHRATPHLRAGCRPGAAWRRDSAGRSYGSAHGTSGARSALRRIGADTDVITYVSRYTRDRFASAFGPDARLEHLPPGVDTECFRPDPLARAGLRERYRLGDRPTTVCVSRLVARKGQDMLIRAMPEIRRRVAGAALVIVGGGPDADTLHKLAQHCGVAADVVFTGGVPAAELPGHYAMADVFAMPCRTRGAGLDVEGLGIVFLEAAAAGVPVVAGRSGGAPETVRDGETGRVVNGRAHEEIVDAITDLLTDPDRARLMGQAGRDWISRDWNWQTHSGRLAALLRVAPPR